MEEQEVVEPHLPPVHTICVCLCVNVSMCSHMLALRRVKLRGFLGAWLSDLVASLPSEPSCWSKNFFNIMIKNNSNRILSSEARMALGKQ